MTSIDIYQGMSAFYPVKDFSALSQSVWEFYKVVSLMQLWRSRQVLGLAGLYVNFLILIHVLIIGYIGMRSGKDLLQTLILGRFVEFYFWHLELVFVWFIGHTKPGADDFIDHFS